MLGIVNFLVCSLLFLNAGFIKSGRLGHFCPNETLYDSNSSSGKIYRTNLDFLLSVLTANASRPNGFYNFSTDRATDPPRNTNVYGLFLCRGDVGTGECRNCVETARSEVIQVCPDIKVATIWYRKCMLRYSDRSIFSTLDSGGFKITKTNLKNATERDEFAKVLLGTFNQVTTAAASDLSGKKFAVRESYVNGLQMIYALGQCTPDLSSLDCRTCLGSLVQSIADYYPNGEKVLTVNCNIRYETYLFYNVSGFPPPPPPPHLWPPLAPATSTQATSKGEGGFSTITTVAIVVPTFVAIFAVVVVFCAIWKAKRAKTHDIQHHKAKGESSISIDRVEFIRYKLSQVEACTSNFSAKNMIGRGGFGSVYKGTFQNEQIVAVKRLSKGSKQGGGEFMNEITVVAKLQHKNLVRLLGYCLERDERILIYEFVVNKSLDYFLFDPEKQPLLDWLMRYNIIEGIARGLLYLHEDSRIKIIHRDLKAANVLLDGNMNPKITDFGLARLLESDQCEGNTRKIAGTFGYMAPEYLLYGKLSVKLDVFSFGVLVMEIISGKRNNGIQCFGDDDLLTYARKQWRNGTPLAVMDPTICGIYDRNEVIRCIYVGLLCVVKKVERRPSMASVVLMLTSCSIQLPIPNEPAFFDWRRTSEIQVDTDSDKRSSQPENSINEVSMTEFYPR